MQISYLVHHVEVRAEHCAVARADTDAELRADKNGRDAEICAESDAVAGAEIWYLWHFATLGL